MKVPPHFQPLMHGGWIMFHFSCGVSRQLAMNPSGKVNVMIKFYVAESSRQSYGLVTCPFFIPPFQFHVDIFKMSPTSLPELHACGCGKMNGPLSV